MREGNFQVLNQAVDVSTEYGRLENQCFVATEVVVFDPSSGQGTLRWKRHSRKPRLPVRRLFEAEVVVEAPPVVRTGVPIRPGTIRLRVRNLGDAVDSAVIRIRPHGGRIEGDGTLSCVLEPFAVAEQCYTLWAEVGTIQIELGRDGADGVIGGLGVEAIDEALTPGPKP